MHEDEEEMKTNALSSPGYLKREPSWMQEVDINIKIEEYQKCVGCKGNITPKDEQMEAYTIIN